MNRRQWDAKIKATMALEGFKGKPVTAICQDYRISQAKHDQRRGRFLSHVPRTFEVAQETECEARLQHENARINTVRLIGRLCLVTSLAWFATYGPATVVAEPPSSKALIEQGHAYEAGQQYQEAEALYRESLSRDPENDEVRAALARVLSRKGSYQEAIDLYRTILGRHPGDLDIRTELARVLSWQQSWVEAKALYKEVLREAPQHVEAIEGLANLFYWEDHLDEARIYYEQAYALTKNPALAERLALINSEQSHRRAARASHGEAAESETSPSAVGASMTSPRAPLGLPDTTVRLPFRDYVKIGYGQFSYSRDIPNEHNVLVEAAKPLGGQTLVARVESLHRFGFHDVPLSAELYSPLWRQAWGYMAAQGTVDAQFAPRYSVSGEIVQGMGILHPVLSVFEASMGYRRLSYTTDDINLLMPGLTIYLPFNTWLTEQLYWIPQTGAMTLASRLTWRPTPRLQAVISGSFGTTGERIVASQDLTLIRSHTVQAGVIVPLAERISLEATGYYEDRGFLYTRQGGLFGILYHW